MRATLILFDVDGTLVDTAGAGRRAMERACHEVLRVDGIALKTARVRYAGMTDPVIMEALALALGIDRIQLTGLAPELQRRYLVALQAEMQRPDSRRRVLPGVKELLELLHLRHGVHLGLLTGNIEQGARAKLEPFGLNGYFPAGGFSSDHPERRQIARIAWRKLCELTRVDFPASDVVVVGDTEHDVDCARANGFRAVAVHSGWVPRGELARVQPDALLDSLSDMSRALEALGLR